MLVPYHTLLGFTERLFSKIGCSTTEAQIAAKNLVLADLRGIDSHGVARLSGYIRLWENKRITTNPNIQIIHQTPTTATVDGDSGLGLVVAAEAMQIAIEKAKVYGTGWVSVQNSNHFGIAAAHAMLALEHDMIGISMTNASPLVAPTFANEPLLGTNPMCFAIPAGTYPPVVVDMATAAAANGKLEIAQRKGAAIPEGWIQDSKGNSSTDAHELKNGGALLPLGSDSTHGSHKGYALSAVVDIFSGVLSGANYGPWVPPFVAFLDPKENLPGKGIGHFFGAMRIDAFRPKEDFYTHIDNWITRFKEAKPIDSNQPVVIPGEPEAAHHAYRLQHGIPLHAAVVTDLIALGKKFDVDTTFLND